MTDLKTDTEDGEIIAASSTLVDKIKAEAMEWARLLVVFIPALFFFSMLLFEQRVIPSESMVPALQVGDRVVVNKFAYGYSRYSVPWGVQRILPLGNGRLFGRMPERGDVIVFMHPHTSRVMIKRLIGLPGDHIEVYGNRTIVNGKELRGSFLRQFWYDPNGRRETTLTREYLNQIGEVEFPSHEWSQDTIDSDVFIVPEGHFFFMGDNRDNSLDSRHTRFRSTNDLEALRLAYKNDPDDVPTSSGHCRSVNDIFSSVDCDPTKTWLDDKVSIGYVPFDHLIGRAETVLWTTKRCATNPRLECAGRRVWKGL